MTHRRAAVRIQPDQPGIDGKYRVPNLPAGEYLLGAVTDVEQYQWFDPAFLAEVKKQAIPLALADGELKVQDLRIGGGREEALVLAVSKEYL